MARVEYGRLLLGERFVTIKCTPTVGKTDWYRQATYDLKAARWNIEGGFHNTACFLAQQAEEKALKSLLYYLGARKQALFTHSLVEMIREAGKKTDAVPAPFASTHEAYYTVKHENDYGCNPP